MRRHAARLQARFPLALPIALGWGLRSAFGWLAALPALALVAASGVARIPMGDRALFEPGALFLTELARLQAPHFGPVLRNTLLALFALGCLRSVPLALLFVSAAMPGASLRDRAERAFSAAPRFVFLLLLELVAVGLALALGALAASAVSGIRLGNPSDRARDLLGACALGLGAVVAACASAFADSCRAGAVLPAHQRGFELAWRAFSSHAGALAGRWLLCTGLGALLVALGARAAQGLDVGRPGDARLWAVAVAHQLVLLLLTVLEAAWIVHVVRHGRPRASGRDASEREAQRSAPPE